VGIDAEVYLLYRFREEFPKDRDFHRALFDAFTLVREPLIFSFTALVAGCLAVSIVPLYVGYVGFSMALILLATFLLSFFVAPVVWSLMRPRFLTRGLEEDSGAPPSVGTRETQVRHSHANTLEAAPSGTRGT
jgi:predicted RND superfamily exporter protein